MKPKLTAEPHDEHHAFGDLMFAEFIAQHRQRVNVAGTTHQAHDDAPDDQPRLESLPETEQGQAQVGENARFRDEGQRPHGLLHGDLSHRRQIKMRVMWHDDAVEQNGHDTWNGSNNITH